MSGMSSGREDWQWRRLKSAAAPMLWDKDKVW